MSIKSTTYRYKFYNYNELVSERDKVLWKVDKYIAETYKKGEERQLEVFIHKTLREHDLLDAYTEDYLFPCYYYDTTIMKAIEIFDTKEKYSDDKFWSNVEDRIAKFITTYCIHKQNVNPKDNFNRIYREYKNRNLDEYLRYMFNDAEGIVL